ncbi:MAG: ABC transporter ATP-binding protein [Acidobacteriota bacterium]|nr:ABC transporter ATP-binding protein [Acidobacteriota bacterium]
MPKGNEKEDGSAGGAKAACGAPGGAVVCRGVSRDYGGKRVLDGVDLRVEAGTVTAVVGPMGAGKTTLLKMLAGIVPPTAGRIEVAGFDMRTDGREARRRIGYVPAEERSFFWRLTGRQNLDFFGGLHGLRAAEKKRRIEAALRRLGLADQADAAFRNYSSGMKQALSLARGLLHEPAVLLLDEPGRSLSVEIAARVHGIIREWAEKRGAAVVLASHDVGDVKRTADRLLILKRGRVEAEGPIGEVRRAIEARTQRDGGEAGSALDEWDEAFRERMRGGA